MRTKRTTGLSKPVLALILRLARRKDGVWAADLAERAGVGLATAHRWLKKLVQAGMLVVEETPSTGRPRNVYRQRESGE